MFSSDSRYAKLAPITTTGPDGTPVLVAPIRFISPVEPVLARRTRDGDRPDLLAHEFYKEPQRFWRIADANRVMRPRELVDVSGILIGIPTKS
jgi:hypothetical protein